MATHVNGLAVLRGKETQSWARAQPTAACRSPQPLPGAPRQLGGGRRRQLITADVRRVAAASGAPSCVITNSGARFL